jgi:hypothetical protein
MTDNTGKLRRGMDPAAHAKAMARLHAFLERRWMTKPMDPWAFQFQYLAGPIPMPCYAQINPEMEGFLFRAVLLGSGLDKKNYENVALLCEIHNGKLPVGCFAFNRENGEVRYKSGLYFWGTELTERMMRNVIEPSIMLLDDHILSLVHVCVGHGVEESLARVGEDPGIGTSEHCHYRHEPHPRVRGG